MFGLSPRDMKKLMRQFGIKIEELKVERAVLELEDGRILILEPPTASFMMKQKGQPPTFYLVGSPREEKREEAKIEISEEDIELVAEQAGVSREEAKKALEEAGGDIAEAILRLKGES